MKYPMLEKVLGADIERKRLGYKVMRHQNGKAVSGANNGLSFDLKKGATVRMPGNGIYLTLDKEYARTYYSGHDDNVLITFEFDPFDVKWGNLTDRETEFSVSEAKILDWEVYSGEE